MSSGELGLWCSNIMIWQDAVIHNYNNIIIIEDDIKIIKPESFKKQLENFLSNIPKTYDLAYIGLNPPKNKNETSVKSYIQKFFNKKNSYGSFATAFSYKALDKLLSFDCYDNPIDLFYLKHINLVTKEPVVSFEAYKSSIDIVNAFVGLNSTIDEMGR